MLDILLKLFPTFEKTLPEFIQCIFATAEMVLISGGIAIVIGTIFGIILIVTARGAIMENSFIYNFLDKAINIIRSIPFMILMVLLIPVSRKIVGTGIGVKGVIIPLIAGTVPFYSRQIESAIAEVDKGLIEAAQAFGKNRIQIITGVYLRESIPSIVRVTSTTLVNLIGLTAMAGALGAGGLGDFAIRYGYQRGKTDMIWATVIVILLMISVIQLTGKLIIKETTH